MGEQTTDVVADGNALKLPVKNLSLNPQTNTALSLDQRCFLQQCVITIGQFGEISDC